MSAFCLPAPFLLVSDSIQVAAAASSRCPIPSLLHPLVDRQSQHLSKCVRGQEPAVFLNDSATPWRGYKHSAVAESIWNLVLGMVYVVDSYNNLQASDQVEDSEKCLKRTVMAS